MGMWLKGRPGPRRCGTELVWFCLTPLEAEGTCAQHPVTVLEANTAAQGELMATAPPVALLPSTPHEAQRDV